jgi:D-alanine-D-alanine ligase
MYNIALIAGGDSGEYEVSLRTADNIFQMLDKNLFKPYLIHFKGSEWTWKGNDGSLYPIDKNDFSLMVAGEKITFDIIFIAIHGTPGENGKLQSYLEMLGLPYTGCGSFCSALTFNKYYCNLAVAALGIPIAPSLHFYRTDPVDYAQIEAVCGYPCFVKSCNSGSSVGVTKVHSAEELAGAFAEAFKYDNQLMVEKFVRGREMTCGVTSVYGSVQTLAVTEVVASNEFYDYDAKYSAVGHKLLTPAAIRPEDEALLRKYSECIFHNLDCKGVVRVDFIISEDDGKPYFLEINTIPGQTALSIIPDQVKFKQLDLTDFYTRLAMEALPQS